MRVDTRKFEAVHGSKPRGDGLWVFALTIPGFTKSMDVTQSGTFSEAKKLAVAVARDVGAIAVKLES
jgi:hypothetical protein